ncbi:MAG TPA: ATP-binding protein [Thermoanaerobaculia bacterium]|nr:ATP-binding protein [Thermoanaerobaculia bacterium]
MTETSEAPPRKFPLPAWATELVSLYQSRAANQFILYGNVNDRFVLPNGTLGNLTDFLMRVMMPRFDVVLTYDLGNGIRIEKGGEIFCQWPAVKESPELPKSPRAAIETLTRYFRYSANLGRLGKEKHQIGCIIKAAHLVAPALPGSLNYDLNALAMLMRDWATDDLLLQHSLVTWLVTDNLNDLNPLLVHDPRSASVEIPLPTPADLREAFDVIASRYPLALAEFQGPDQAILSTQLAGTTISSIENLLKMKEYGKEKISGRDLVEMKKQLVEKDSADLVEFIESNRSLDDMHAQEKLKGWLRQDLALWRQNDLNALPMGYLICGPVGTGKTFMVECLAGEAGIPVVKIKNFRDKWVGSSEGNLEKIFRLLKGLGRCFVFIDEADQALGKRDSGANDAGLSGRIYSMFAKEMSNSENRGRMVWVLASSRPDLIEVDLKRPGRVDVKIPIFPTTNPEEGFELIRALSKRRGVDLAESDLEVLRSSIPQLLTPGAAEALAVKIYRTTRTQGIAPLDAVRQALTDYQNPVARDVLDFQIGLAVREATDIEFVPALFRSMR